MDFWDLTKVLARRWMITLPLLALSATLTVLTVGQVRPDYVATAYAQPLPPAPTPTPAPTGPGQTTPDQRNPWLGLGLTAISNAAIVMVMDQSVIDELEAAGNSGSYTIEMGSSSPLTTFEVTGKSERQARETAEQLVLRFSQSVAALQRAYGVSPQDSITVRRLDLGKNVHESNANVKRALVAVAAAGLLLTVAVTVGVDALLRRRRRRRVDNAATLAPATQPTPPSRASVTTAMASQASDGTPTRAGLAETTIPAGNGASASPADGGPGGMAAQLPPSIQVATAAEANHRGHGSAPEALADATVVLQAISPPDDHRSERNGEREQRS